MDLQYSDRDVGHLLGVWLVIVGLLALSTTRPSYTPVVGPLADPAVFCSLLGLLVVGAARSRYCDLALGAPMSVCGGLVVWSACQQFLVETLPLTGRRLLIALGLVVFGGLFVREGVVIARGRRHRV
ncbi:hypothetical protein [Halohasta litorea]|uniref:SPW repeat-containing protein n=1 Tax=Halohasta litorea TaxID=869891 RepID=A0ABD6D8V0_9EURY|nr:hypothetical protein [Halohasta litorea]